MVHAMLNYGPFAALILLGFAGAGWAWAGAIIAGVCANNARVRILHGEAAVAGRFDIDGLRRDLISFAASYLPVFAIARLLGGSGF